MTGLPKLWVSFSLYLFTKGIILQDRLVWLLDHFDLKATVFQAGRLACEASYAAQAGVGYLHLLQSGRLSASDTGTATRTINEPSVLLYMNPMSHRLIPDSNDVSMVCALFEFGLGTGNPLATALPEVITIPLRDLPSLTATLEQLFSEAVEQHCGRQAILNRLMEVALILIIRDLMDQNRLQVGLLAGLADSKLAKAINAMHAEPNGDWTLNNLARVAGMSRARFAIRFREIVGTTPGAYLSEWRIGLAQSLLQKGRAVSEIADAVGYGSASALSRTFNSRCGMSPSTWLKLNSANRRSPQGESA